MYSITLSINSPYLEGTVVKRACEILNGYVDYKANDAKHTCVFPYLQIYVSQLPSQAVRRLSTQLDRRDYELLEAHTICHCPDIDNGTDYVDKYLPRQHVTMLTLHLLDSSLCSELRLCNICLSLIHSDSVVWICLKVLVGEH